MEPNYDARPHRSLSDITADLPYLRDFLRVKQDNKPASRTLGAILSEYKPSKKTLLDTILDEPWGDTSGDTVGSNRNMWRSFKDKFHLLPTSAEQTPELPLQVSSYDSTIGELINGPGLNSIPSNQPMAMRRDPSTVQNTALMTNPYEVEGEERESEESGERGEAPARMSLMALLAKTDKQMVLNGSPIVTDVSDEEEKELNKNCCVCMVRRKGAAFIPCGHTFCRLCSRELWVQRGTCPICNKFILEILDIF